MSFLGAVFTLPRAIFRLSLGGSMYRGQQQARAAAREQGQIAAAQQQALAAQQKRAQDAAAKQEAQRQRSLRRIAQGRVRAARRRVRGGLFGDTQVSDQYNVSSRLGG